MKKPDNLLSTDHLGPLLNFLPKIFNKISPIKAKFNKI